MTTSTKLPAVPKGGCIPIPTPERLRIVWLPEVEWPCVSHDGLAFCAPTVATPAIGKDLVGEEVLLPLVAAPYCRFRGDAIAQHPAYGVVRTIGWGLNVFTGPNADSIIIGLRSAALHNGGRWVTSVGEGPEPSDFPVGEGLVDLAVPAARGLREELGIEVSVDALRPHIYLSAFAGYSPGGLGVGMAVNLGALGYDTDDVLRAHQSAVDGSEALLFAVNVAQTEVLTRLEPWDEMGRYLTRLAIEKMAVEVGSGEVDTPTPVIAL